MKTIRTLLLVSLTIFIISCEKKYEDGFLPTTPTNLSDFNTEHDDYNSTAPTLGDLIPFCFSTNRNSGGENFDVIYEPMNVSFDKTSGELTVSNNYSNWGSLSGDYEIIEIGINKIKTIGNEFGPNLLVDRKGGELNFTLLYSSDVTGKSQINFISTNTTDSFSEPREVAFLNSDKEDLYPTFNSDRSKIYFCSNREGGNFNFFEVEVDPNLDTETLLTDSSNYEILKETVLSSNSDDKCPFIFGDLMVFTSDRAGGFGGYDLYYSKMENGEWKAPINFGASINTEADEFRPILIEEGVASEQTMMVFSSNRDGGLGGFDLYFVGIDKSE